MSALADVLERAILQRLVSAETSVSGSCLIQIVGGCHTPLGLSLGSVCRVHRGGLSAHCQITFAEEDVDRFVTDHESWPTLFWSDRTLFRGPAMQLRKILDVLFPDRNGNGYYTSLAYLVPDSKFIFMNHGYARSFLEPSSAAGSQGALWQYQRCLVDHILDGVDLRGRRVLEIGCGRGGTSSYIMGRFQPRSYSALDRCVASILFCKDRHCITNLNFSVGDACKLSYASETFDVVVNIESSHAYNDISLFLAEVSRVLELGGHFCYTDGGTVEGISHVSKLIESNKAFQVLRSMDITENVAAAIDLNRLDLESFMVSLANDKLGNRRILSLLSRHVNQLALRKYRSREWLYHSWLIRRKLAWAL